MAKRSSKVLTFVLIPLVAASFGAGLWVRHRAVPFAVEAQSSKDYEGQKYASLEIGKPSPLDTIFAVLTYLRKSYVDEIKDQTPLTYGALRGMAGFFNDPNTRFLEPKDYVRYQDELNGRFNGIGAIVAVRRKEENVDSPGLKKELARLVVEATAAGESARELDFTDNSIFKSYVTVLTPAVGGPAEKAGLEPGDRVEYINDRWVMSYPAMLDIMEQRTAYRNNRIKRSELEAAIKKLEAKTKGAYLPLKAVQLLETSDKPLKLKVARVGRKDLVEVTVAPAPFSVKPVTYTALDKSAGYVRIVSFCSETAPLLRSAINTLRNGGATSFVIDLRNNATGSRADMLQTLESLGVAGVVAKVQSRRGSEDRSDLKTTGTASPGRVVVLVNRGTANLAEVFAAALRDRRSAKLAGSQTAGDTMAREIIELGDASAFMLATGKYFTSAGQDFSEVGLAPDAQIEGVASPGSPETDPAVARARQLLKEAN